MSKHHLPIHVTKRRKGQHRRTSPSAISLTPPTPEENEQERKYFNQWDQHENRDKESSEKQQEFVNQLTNRQRHFHIFLQPSSTSIIRSAISRFISSFPTSTTTTSTKKPGRVWILRAIADPTFGELRSEPYPARCTVIADSAEYTSIVERWVNALDRSGNALSPMDSHYVDWAMCSAHYSSTDDNNEDDDQPLMGLGWLVSFEILNANWVRSDAVSGMRKVIEAHGKDVVQAGFAKSYEIFQCVNEPTCFKTVEVYENLQTLKKCIDEKDSAFEKEAEVHRAAVYRVRQLHECIALL